MKNSGSSAVALVRPRVGGRAARIVVVAIVLAAALTSCRSGMGPAAVPSDTVAPSPSDAAGPTAEPTPSATAAGEPTATPSPSTMPVGSVTIITLGVVDGAVQATGILPQDVDTDGQCTLTISHDGVTRSESVAATPGRESTYCGVVNIAVEGLEPGGWDAVLSYRSPTSSAESAPMQVQLP